MTTTLQRTIAITGAASGIGAATAHWLRAEGHRVITVDRHQADVTGDLATAPGRWRAIASVTRLAGGRLDGLVHAPTLAAIGTGVIRWFSVRASGPVSLLALGKSDLDALTVNFPVLANKVLIRLAGIMAMRLQMLIDAETVKTSDEPDEGKL